MLKFSWRGQVGSKEEPLKGQGEVAISSLWESNLRRRHDEGKSEDDMESCLGGNDASKTGKED